MSCWSPNPREVWYWKKRCWTLQNVVNIYPEIKLYFTKCSKKFYLSSMSGLQLDSFCKIIRHLLLMTMLNVVSDDTITTTFSIWNIFQCRSSPKLSSFCEMAIYMFWWPSRVNVLLSNRCRDRGSLCALLCLQGDPDIVQPTAGNYKWYWYLHFCCC